MDIGYSRFPAFFHSHLKHFVQLAHITVSVIIMLVRSFIHPLDFKCRFIEHLTQYTIQII
jgi:hypothetical protein